MDPRKCILWHLLFATSLSLSLLAVSGSAQQTTEQKAQPKKPAAGAAKAEPEEHEGDNVRRREEWFYRQRRFPLAHIPGGARQQALDRKEEMRREQQAARANRAASPADAAATATPGTVAGPAPLGPSMTTWTHVGPMPAVSADSGVGLVSGRVSAIAVDPTNANIVFVGGAQGGVWKSVDGGATWATTFDGSKSLAIGAIAIDPANPNTIYVGTGEQNFSGDSYYGAGIYKSTDGGATWNQTTGTILNPQGGAPASFTGPFNQAVGGVRVSAMVVHPSNSNKVFAGVQIFQNFDGGVSSGIYCSDNAGQTWTQVLHGAIGTDIQIHPANIAPGGTGSVGYAALGSPGGDTSTVDITGQNGVYKSTNANAACNAQTWTVVSKAPVPVGTSAGAIRIGVAPSDATGMTVYAAVSIPITTANSGDNLAGVFKTTNGGTSWSTVTPATDFCISQCSYDLVVKVHPNNANTVFLGGSRAFSGSVPFWLIATTDGGATWNQIARDAGGNTLHVDQHALAFGLAGAGAPKIYVGNDGGISSTALPAPGSAITSNTVAWSNLNNGLEMLQFYPGLSIHPATNQIAYAGTQDNGTLKMDAGGASPLEWNELPPCGDGGYTAIDPLNPAIIYAACENIDVQKSINGGVSFSAIDGTINANDRSEFIAPLVMDPTNSQKLYFGTYRVWQTMNGGTSWSAISPDLTSGAANGDDITSISVSPVNPNVVYVGTFGDGSSPTTLQWTANANIGMNANWVALVGGTLPPRAITQVAADPNNQNVVFVTMSGFSGFLSGDTKGHVFKCSFVVPIGCTDISGGLPNIPVNAILVDPLPPLGSNTIYIGTDVGVFGTINGGATWTVDYPGAPNGLPNVAVLGMALHTGTRVLRVVTHGRSAWDLQLGGLPAYDEFSINPTSAAAGSASVNLTVNGNGFTTNSTIQFNGTPLTTTFVNATQLTGIVPAALVANPATVQVNVVDTSLGTTPTSLPFSITTATPTVTGSLPAGTPVNTAVPSMVITGTNFITSSQVHINNNGGSVSDSILLTAANISNNGTTITVTVPANAQSVQNAGTYFISVFNPPPGGGDSSNGPQVPPNFTVTPLNNNPPPNDNFANAIVAGTNAFTDTQNTVNATTQNTDPVPSCTVGSPGLVLQGGANSIWYSFTATGPGTIAADTMGSLDDTILEVVTGAPGAFAEVACNDDINPGVVRTSQLNFTATQGTTYFFMVASFEGFGGKVVFNLNATIAGPTNFTLSAVPTSQTVTRGQSGMTVLTVSPNIALFPGDVTFACTGLPSESACLFNPTKVLQAAGATPVTVTITTTAPSSVPPRPWRGPGGRPIGLLLWALAALSLMALLAARRKTRSWRYALSFVLIAVFAGLAMSCGGGGGGGGGGGNVGSQPLGANNVMIKATSGNVSQTVPFTLTLQ